MEIRNDHWTRPFGPPIVWRTIDAKEKLDDNTFADVRLSIQDIPEDRYEETLDHMCEYYLADEVMNKCLGMKSDLVGVSYRRLAWNYCLKLGMSIGAFKVNSNGKLGELIGVMILLVSSDEHQRRIDEILASQLNSKSSIIRKIFTFASEAGRKIDIQKMYGVDKYICEWGLSVKPSFRHQKIGLHLLDVWPDIGRKYGITVGKANFSSAISQFLGERAGFKTIYSMKYSEALEEDGQPLFPNIQSDKWTVAVKIL